MPLHVDYSTPRLQVLMRTLFACHVHVYCENSVRPFRGKTLILWSSRSNPGKSWSWPGYRFAIPRSILNIETVLKGDPLSTYNMGYIQTNGAKSTSWGSESDVVFWTLGCSATMREQKLSHMMQGIQAKSHFGLYSQCSLQSVRLALWCQTWLVLD